MKFACPTCEKEFVRKVHLDNHLNKKTKCVKLTEEDKNNDFYCVGCSKLLSRKDHYTDHIKKCKKYYQHLVNSQNTTTTESHNTTTTSASHNSNNASDINHSKNNIAGNTNTLTDNSVINNYYINDFGKENLDYISSKVISHILQNHIKEDIPLGPKKEFDVISELAKAIHFNKEHKENMNIHFLSKTANTYVFSKNNDEEWLAEELMNFSEKYLKAVYTIARDIIVNDEELEFFSKEKNLLNKLNSKLYAVFVCKYKDIYVKDFAKLLKKILIDNHDIVMDHTKKYKKQMKKQKLDKEIVEEHQDIKK